MRSLFSPLVAVATIGLGFSGVAAQSMPGATQHSLGAFGGAVAVVGDQVLVGEPDNRSRPGTVYIYTRDGSGWVESGSFTAPGGETGDGFGASLAADGSTLLVGGSNVVHVFEQSGGSWTQTGTIAPGMAGEDSGFGAAVALYDGVAVVGAPSYGENGEGAAFLFSGSGGSWTEVATVRLEDAGENAAFGRAIAIDDGLAMVGAPGMNAIGTYRIDAMGAELVNTLAPDFGGPGGQVPQIGFGGSLTIDGDRAAVAATAAGVYLTFNLVDGEWEPDAQLRAFSASGFGGGGSVGMTFAASDLWVANPSDGGAYVFSQDGEGNWVQARRIALDAGAPSTIASANGVVALGIPGADSGLGQAAILSADGDFYSVDSAVMSEVDGYDAVRGGEVDCAEGEASVWDCDSVDLVGFIPVKEMGADRGIGTNDVWGWTDPETRKEWAIVGMRDQTTFVDVSDPTNPIYVGRIKLTDGARPSSWRDIKTFGDHAFIVSDGAGEHGMQVFDLTRLRDFDGTPETYEADALYTGIASAHNIVINEDTGMAFAVGSSGGGETCGGGLHMIDVNDPVNPTFVGCFADPQTGRASTGYSHDAQCVTYRGPDEEYTGREICLGSNETALSIADVTDRENPIALSRASYPNFGYSHQGWLDDEHRYFYMNDELDELQGLVNRTRTLIWDVTDLDDPQLVLEHLGTQESSDHNLYVVGDVMYQSNYQSGLRVLDISDRESPVEIGYFDTVPYGDNSAGFGGSWSNYPFFDSGLVIVTSGSEGLFILRPRNERVIS